MIPYGRHTIDEDDIHAVREVLKSGWITRGPKVLEFEKSLAQYTDAKYAVVFANGTLALQGAFFASGIQRDDEFITTPLTFISTVTSGIWLGARPVYADIDRTTGNISASEIEKRITKKTKLIATVDYAGNPCDYDEIQTVAKRHNLLIIQDASHSLGASYKNKKIGSLSNMTVLSFHPVKSMTTGEGGAVTTDSEHFYKRLLTFRNNGIMKEKNYLINKEEGEWRYEMQELGVNCHLTDFQCALGISQLKKLNTFIRARREIAHNYCEALKDISAFILPVFQKDRESAWHIFVIRMKDQQRRKEIFHTLKNNGIGVSVHYLPVYKHPYFQKHGYTGENCVEAERFYDSAITIPLFPTLSREDQIFIIEKLKNAVL